jgi:uncharacterized protein YjbJ (UPF0337 family)
MEDKVKATAKKMEGKLEAAAGELTGDQEMKLRGEAKQVKGAAMDAAGQVKDKAKGVVDNLKNATNDALDNVKDKLD